MTILNFCDNNVYVIILTLIGLAMLFIITGHTYRDQIQSVLKNTLITMPRDTIDYWSISHFVLFGLFGFLKPNHHLTAMTVGVLFELFEDNMASDENTQLTDCKKNKLTNFWCNGLQDDYWYAKASDVFWNLFGYTIGSAIRTTLY